MNSMLVNTGERDPQDAVILPEIVEKHVGRSDHEEELEEDGDDLRGFMGEHYLGREQSKPENLAMVGVESHQELGTLTNYQEGVVESNIQPYCPAFMMAEEYSENKQEEEEYKGEEVNGNSFINDSNFSEGRLEDIRRPDIKGSNSNNNNKNDEEMGYHEVLITDRFDTSNVKSNGNVFSDGESSSEAEDDQEVNLDGELLQKEGNIEVKKFDEELGDSKDGEEGV